MRYRPAATACATSLRTSTPASRPTRSSTRARSARSCGSGPAIHPEFSWLPRKFKIAISGAREDRAAVAFHDIGLHLVRSAAGETGFRVLVGGGMGRTPMIGSVIREFLPWQDMLTYVESILRVYNLHGRRDNIFKARIKILVRALGVDEFARQVEADFAEAVGGATTLTAQELERVLAHFTPPPYETLGETALPSQDRAFLRWVERNVRPHRVHGYRAVVLSLKATGFAPGDITDQQLDTVADWAERYGFGEVRVSHQQNLLLPDVRVDQLHALWIEARAAGLATPNIGLLTDVIACPGGDFCSLANAKSIPIAQDIQRRFDDLDFLHDLGELNLNISGCINSCGHHHVGHIGILGVDKDGEEWYQVSIGGADGSDAAGGRNAVGRIIGPSFAAGQVTEVVARLIDCYVELRDEGERFIDTVTRVGVGPFKDNVYRHVVPAQRDPATVAQAAAAGRTPPAARGDLMASSTTAATALPPRILHPRRHLHRRLLDSARQRRRGARRPGLRCCRSPTTSRSRSPPRTACGSRRPTTPRRSSRIWRRCR